MLRSLSVWREWIEIIPIKQIVKRKFLSPHGESGLKVNITLLIRANFRPEFFYFFGTEHTFADKLLS